MRVAIAALAGLILCTLGVLAWQQVQVQELRAELTSLQERLRSYNKYDTAANRVVTDQQLTELAEKVRQNSVLLEFGGRQDARLGGYVRETLEELEALRLRLAAIERRQ